MRQIYHLLLTMSQYNENVITENVINETMNVKSLDFTKLYLIDMKIK